MKSCSEVMRESSRRTLKSLSYVKEEVKIQEARNAGESLDGGESAVPGECGYRAEDANCCMPKDGAHASSSREVNAYLISEIKITSAFCKVAFERACCKRLQIAYFEAEPHPTYLVHSSGFYRYVLI